MSEKSAKRKRRTNRLVREAATHLFKQGTPLPEQLYGLCKLTWITTSNTGAAYVRSTKMPALENIFGRSYSKATISEVAEDVVSLTHSQEMKSLIVSDTGFTNFYEAYRNSARKWIEDNFKSVLPLFRTAYNLTSDEEGLKLARKIMHLPGIPKANHETNLMQPEYLLTPVFFALDPRLRFPLINGNGGVTKLLKKLKVYNAPLDVQYQQMISLYGKGGIADAADLDEAGGDLPDFVGIGGNDPTKQFLKEKKIEGNKLPLKDESDIKILQKELAVKSRRIHNKLTNKLMNCLSEYKLLEGSSKAAMFDVLVKNFDGKGADLLVEVKSSVEAPQIRMAVGQVFDYWFRMKSRADPCVAILLPGEPDDSTRQLLEWLKIGLMWFSKEKLTTCSDWLTCLADNS